MGRPRLTSYVMLKRKVVEGKKLEPGDRVPAGLVSAAKLKQLADWHIVADTGTAVGEEEAAKRSHVFDKSDVAAD